MSEWSQLDELEGKLIDSWWASKEDKELFEEMRVKAEAFDEWRSFMSYHLMSESGEYYGVDSDKVNAKMIELFDKYESGEF